MFAVIKHTAGSMLDHILNTYREAKAAVLSTAQRAARFVETHVPGGATIVKIVKTTGHIFRMILRNLIIATLITAAIVPVLAFLLSIPAGFGAAVVIAGSVTAWWAVGLVTLSWEVWGSLLTCVGLFMLIDAFAYVAGSVTGYITLKSLQAESA